MSDVHGNPNEMRQFAYYLDQLAMEFRERKNITKIKMNQLNDSWRDSENSDFQERFNQDMKPIDKLISTAEEYGRFLQNKAKKLDDYIQTKF